MTERTFIHASDLAKRWGLSLRTIQRQCRDGSVPSMTIGRKVLIPLDRIEALEAEQLGEHAPAEAAD